MSRAIKFRVWLRKTGKMILPYAMIQHEKGAGWFEDEKSLRIWDIDMYEGESGKYEVMQFTGLLDKHGNEIYEGDIVQCDRWPMSDDIALVAWGQLGWQPFLHLIARDEHVADLYEIIGNLYENPELVAKERE